MSKTTDPFQILAKRLKQLREERGWTDKQMAGRADLDLKTYRNLELGQPATGTTLYKVCQALGIRLGELFDGI